ncbi:TspO/MBR family protein [Microcella frigidaquae]|uniref:Tryptophan-rich sensory protein n=1 Tax=Microcella frigidaquae TaxID=424758 RepID=A0A840XKN4_9MICO|nr:TspO/MBR family protein [Microcella frigidaquae]MBB5618846.1 tryptophan-rich sensory protein [Microcella frigidaquae]NHN44947.1 tryptophan-rich sensory protein [Microcella frigidaquae]
MTATRPGARPDAARTPAAAAASASVVDRSARTAPDRRGTRSAAVLVTLLAIAAAVGSLGGLISAGPIEGWYAAAPKPMFAPPDAVFGPVWAVLYVLIAVAGWLVWRAPDSEARTRGLRLYVAQFALNALWTPVFFGLGELVGAPGLWAALVLVVVIDIVILATIIRFGDVSRAAAALLLPYWFWSLFATTLNAAIAVLAG